MTLSMEERVNRMINSSKVIYLEDMTVHEVEAVETVGQDLLYVKVGNGLLYQDTDLMTLDEACDGERGLNFLKKHYKI